MQNVINSISKQFLCAVPLNEWSSETLKIEEFTLEEQGVLIDKTINSEFVLKNPLKLDYQKAFIRYLVDKLEKNSAEVHEGFYEAYGHLVSSSDSKFEYFKHYLVGENETPISLKENVNLISEGTTGLRTWQASLALAEWSLINRNRVNQKRILELGSGIGLTGLVISLFCQPQHIIFSDCHPTVLSTLCENIEFNCERTSQNCLDIEKDESTLLTKKLKSGVNISVLELPWENVNDSFCERLGDIDLILAADVVYDKDLFESLCQALTCISSHCKVQEILFACTERNPATLEEFLDLVGVHFQIEEVDCPKQNNFIWSPKPRVRFFKFKPL